MCSCLALVVALTLTAQAGPSTTSPAPAALPNAVPSESASPTAAPSPISPSTPNPTSSASPTALPSPATSPIVPPTQTSAAKPTFEEWSLFFLDGTRCGFGSTITTPVATPQGPGYRTELQQQFVVKRLGVSLKMTEVSHITERADGAVLSFDQMSSGMGSNIEMRGVREGDDIVVTSRGETQRYRLPALSALGPEAIRRQVDALPLKVGTPFSLNTFTTDYPRAVVVESGTVVDLEDHAVLGAKRKLWKISSQTPIMPGILSISWVDPNNNDVETDIAIPGLGNMQQVVATRAACMKQTDGAEIFASSLIAPQRALTDLPNQAQAVYRLTTSHGTAKLDLWNEGEQRVLKSEPGLSEVEVTVPAWTPEDAAYALPHALTPELRPYLLPSAYLESGAPIIRRLAREAVGSETNPVRAARRIETFVEYYITKKDLNIGFASAEETARSAEGDCTEHAVLCAALGRAVGLPTRCVLGLGYIPPGEARPVISNAVDARTGIFGFHMWAEALIGPDRWVPMDAALGGFDIGHIAIVKSALADVDPMVDLNMPILQLMQNLNITVLSTVRRPERLAPVVPPAGLRPPLLQAPSALPAVTAPPPASPPAPAPSEID